MTITATQIIRLREEAAEAGDLDQVAICDQALDTGDAGMYEALAECERVIREAEVDRGPVYEDDHVLVPGHDGDLAGTPVPQQARNMARELADRTRRSVEIYGDDRIVLDIIYPRSTD